MFVLGLAQVYHQVELSTLLTALADNINTISALDKSSMGRVRLVTQTVAKGRVQKILINTSIDQRIFPLSGWVGYRWSTKDYVGPLFYRGGIFEPFPKIKEYVTALSKLDLSHQEFALLKIIAMFSSEPVSVNADYYEAVCDKV